MEMVSGMEDVQNKIINIRSQQVILDTDVAALYGVETKRVNEAVKNNPDKFPVGYIFQLTNDEKNGLVENFDRFKNLKHSSALPKVFSEKGMYMLATILKSPKATETTINIIEAFSKVREISRTMKIIPNTPQSSPKYQELMQKTGELISDLVIPDDLESSESEATVEVNLALVKFKYTVKKKK